MDQNDDAPHAPTEVQLVRARDRGEVCKSFVLAAAIQAMVVVSVLVFGLNHVATAILNFTQRHWAESLAAAGNANQFAMASSNSFWTVGWALVVLLGLMLVAACASVLIQTGWQWGKKPLVSMNSLMIHRNASAAVAPSRWLPSILGLAIVFAGIGGLVWYVTRNSSLCTRMWRAEPDNWLATINVGIMPVLVGAAGLLLVVGLLDYSWQRWSYNSRLRLTDQQLRDDRRQEETPAKEMLVRRRKGLQMRRQRLADEAES